MRFEIDEVRLKTARKHFASTMGIALREADETLDWLELLREADAINPDLQTEIIDESQQLVAILAASVKTAKRDP
ncbi:MAG TPA: four helix bundle protein [Lacipirellulaceae bacterium]|nr:four helix bundle protein [Lacipirellulaceae bacterium]